MDARALPPPRITLLQGALRHMPGQCEICHSWVRQRICSACLQRWAAPAARCRRCATRLPDAQLPNGEMVCGSCLRQPPPLERCIAALDYAFPWSELLQRYKFNAALELGPVLLERLQLALDSARTEAPDWLLPVPLSTERLRERGFNQSWELARRLAHSRGIASAPDMLLRLRDTAHQLDLPPDRRIANVRQAFAVAPRHAAALRGAHVALFDDVMTTGATLYELARSLRQAGASRVQAWVLARTPDSA